MKRKITYGKGILPVVFLTTSVVSFGQESTAFYNQGELLVSGKTELSTVGEFENSSSGDFINDGKVYFLDDFKNDGKYNFSSLSKEGHTVFEKNDKNREKTVLSGTNGVSFLNISFDTNELSLENEINIKGKSYFKRGNVFVNEKEEGAITFLEGASVEEVGDDSHVVGAVEREGRDELIMPVGNGEYYRPIALGVSIGDKDLFSTVYKYENPLVKRPHTAKNAILEVNSSEYWEVENKAKTGYVIVTLSWNENTTSKNILDKVSEGLHILRWDDEAKVWVAESGEVDSVKKTITTASAINAKGIFTLGIVDSNFTDEIKIYNAVSPNGDGHNDYFIIENINHYPNNSVQIVNRWGSKVFDTNNYDPNGDGSENVFVGQSGGRGVIGNGKLPSGTYYYILKYEKKNGNGTEWVTKSGYLHLENN